MFKFNFSTENKESELNAEPKENAESCFECEEILPEQAIIRKDINVNSIQCGEYNIRYISDKDIIHILESEELYKINNSVLNAEQNHTDLITGVYEGGLKIWECTFDLLHFLTKQEINLTDKRVLDLGCGSGVLGIFACLNGAKTVFQDYNSEVIKFATLPNVSLNNIKFHQCQFYCGDWESFLDKLKTIVQNKRFDYILTSETIYNIHNYEKIINIFKHLLRKDGIIYLAAKYHYFGVGGSIGQFEDLLKKEDIFDYKTCWTCTNGVKRAIIKITFK